MKGGFSRVLISRTVSFLYVIIITRLVIGPTMDQMIVLAAGALIILQISIFGMTYSCQQRSLSTDGEKSTIIRYNAVIFMLVITAPMSFMLALGMTFFVTGFDHPVLFFLYPLSVALLIIIETEKMIESSLLAVDKVILLNLTYSILNSVIVPLFYFMVPTLESILWAWNVASVITVLVDIRKIKQILQNKNFNFPTLNTVFRFGFPVYLALLPKLISQNVINFIIYKFLETGATSIFYWPNRILSIASEMVLIILTGSQELFTLLYTIDRIKLRDSLLGVFRLIIIISSFGFFWIYLNADVIVQILLGKEYLQAIPLLRLLCIAWIIKTVFNVLGNLKSAQGHRRVAVKVNLLDFAGKIFFILILIQFGLIGIVLAEILISSVTLIYLIKNTKYLHTNDNFIRLGSFVIFVMIAALLGSSIEMINFPTFVIVNIAFIILSVVFLFVIRPVTDRDIEYVKKVIPSNLMWILDIYHPSISRYTSKNI